MGDQGISSNNLVQKVFDEISLEKNVQLWMSADDSYLQDRIEFLAEYPQTLFAEHLFDTQKKSNLAKNPILCQGFASKADKLMEKQDWKQALHLLNMSLTFAPTEDCEKINKILLKRAEVMEHLDMENRENVEPQNVEIGFSNCVTIQATEHQGRFTIANRDISPGEVLAIDRPVVKILDKEHTKTHCWHCLRSTQNYPIVPCSLCSGVLFCTESCRQIAQETYHKYECGLTDILYKSDIGVWILAYRSVASYPKETFLQNLHKEDAQLDEYCTLVAHYGSTEFSAPELMKEALVCVFLTRCLQSTGYFDFQETLEPKFGRDELRIALWIHRFMRIARFNCHAIREVLKSKEKVDTLSIGNVQLFQYKLQFYTIVYIFVQLCMLLLLYRNSYKPNFSYDQSFM